MLMLVPEWRFVVSAGGAIRFPDEVEGSRCHNRSIAAQNEFVRACTDRPQSREIPRVPRETGLLPMLA